MKEVILKHNKQRELLIQAKTVCVSRFIHTVQSLLGSRYNRYHADNVDLEKGNIYAHKQNQNRRIQDLSQV